MKREESFGVIPLSRESGQWSVFLIQHKGGRYWGFPKGHAEPNETPQEAAFRELKEETNLDLVHYIQEEPLVEQYQFLKGGERVLKRVAYFIAEVSGYPLLQEQEINAGLWVPFTEAIEKVTHREGKEILLKVAKLIDVV